MSKNLYAAEKHDDGMVSFYEFKGSGSRNAWIATGTVEGLTRYSIEKLPPGDHIVTQVKYTVTTTKRKLSVKEPREIDLGEVSVLSYDDVEDILDKMAALGSSAQLILDAGANNIDGKIIAP